MGKTKRKRDVDSTTTPFESIEGIVEVIRRSKKIIIITGAGISVSCGIPDFRSKEVGLYNHLDCKAIDIPSAELLFDLDYFMIDPVPFYKFCNTLIPKPEIIPSISHDFIFQLEKQKKLLRNYTQNIDGLERKAGISDTKLVECHGSMSLFKCIKCKKKVPLEEVLEDIHSHQVVYCKCGDVMKPAITFFGEDIPNRFHKAVEKDVPICDLIMIIGTSLKVGGSVVNLLKKINHVPHILINRDNISPPKDLGKNFDAVLLGECDCITKYIGDKLGWNETSLRSSDEIVISSPRFKIEKQGDTIFRILTI